MLKQYCACILVSLILAPQVASGSAQDCLSGKAILLGAELDRPACTANGRLQTRFIQGEFFDFIRAGANGADQGFYVAKQLGFAVRELSIFERSEALRGRFRQIAVSARHEFFAIGNEGSTVEPARYFLYGVFARLVEIVIDRRLIDFFQIDTKIDLEQLGILNHKLSSVKPISIVFCFVMEDTFDVSVDTVLKSARFQECVAMPP